MITVGCDPELFVFDKTKETYISAHNYFPGTKHDPHVVGLGAIQVDGTAFEFNIQPAKSLKEFCRNIDITMKIGSNMLKKVNPNLRLEAVPTVVYPQDYFDSLPDETKMLGCDPDFDAYTMLPNTKPITNKPMRTGSGHVHIGWTAAEDISDPAHLFDCQMAVKQMDICLYMTSLLWDDDKQRRELYGNVGAFRPKHYGVEYRVLSNAWLNHPSLIEFVYKSVMKGMDLLDKDVRLWEDPVLASLFNLQRRGFVGDTDLILHASTLRNKYNFPEFPYVALHEDV